MEKFLVNEQSEVDVEGESQQNRVESTSVHETFTTRLKTVINNMGMGHMRSLRGEAIRMNPKLLILIMMTMFWIYLGDGVKK